MHARQRLYGIAQRFSQSSEDGASLVEYLLLAALIAIVCIAGVTVLGDDTAEKMSSVGSQVRG